MNKQEKDYVERYLKTFDEMELRVHVKKYPNQIQTQAYCEQHGLPIILMAKLGINLSEDANVIQKIARNIVKERKQLEQKNLVAEQKMQLQQNFALLKKLKPVISVNSRRRCKTEINEKEGTLIWHCNGIDTLEGGGVRQCQHVQKVSLVIDESARKPNFIMEFPEKYKRVVEVGGKRLLPPTTKIIAGREEIAGGMVETGNSPIIGVLTKATEIMLVMRCLECMRSDELTLKLAVNL